jgi:acyl carrier protein
MPELTPRIVAILKSYMREPTARVDSRTTLSELWIDRLDLPMIFLDIEDIFDVQLNYHDEIEGLATIGSLVDCVASAVAAKAEQRDRRRSTPRKKGNWMSTGAPARETGLRS